MSTVIPVVIVAMMAITCYLFLIGLIQTAIPTIITQTHALQQVVGRIVVEIEPGEMKPFKWGLLTDKDEPNTVNISATGIGAEFLSYPKKVDLTPGEIKNIQANVSIPFDHPGGARLNATMLATEAGERGNTSGSAGIINIQMGKPVDIAIGENPFEGFRELIPRIYTEKVQVANRELSMPIESTSNITGLSFDENERMIRFNATGYPGTNGTTLIYLSNILEAPYFITIDGEAFTDFDSVTNSTTGESGIKITYPHDSTHDNFTIAGARVISPSNN